MVKMAKAVIGPLQVITRVSGQTSARNFVNIIAPRLNGPEMRTLILIKSAKPGSMVRKGDLIAQIDGQALQDHIDDIEDTIRAADADVKKRRAEQAVEFETLQQTLRVAKAELDKARLEYGAAEVRTAIDRELLKLDLDEAEAKYQQAQQDIGSKKSSQMAEIRVLELTSERHKRHHDRHAADLQKLTMRAPLNGLAVMQSVFRGAEFGQVQEGDQLYPGMPFMKIVDPASMQLEANMNQAESSSFRINQPATLRIDAFPGLTLPAHTYSIGALAASNGRNGYFIRTLPIRLKIDGADPRLIPDLSASGDVVLEQAERTLQVPLAAVQSEGGKRFVYVRTADGYEKRTIETGLQSATMAAVTAGLREGEEVTLGTPPSPAS